MGNCQVAEAATVVIQHPGNKVERIYWFVSAHEIMNSNPGNYVALVVTSPTLRAENGLPVKQLKLLRPDDTLLIGHVYRLVSFEDVLKEFAAKKCVKLGKLLKQRGGLGAETKRNDKAGLSLDPNSRPDQACTPAKADQEITSKALLLHTPILIEVVMFSRESKAYGRYNRTDFESIEQEGHRLGSNIGSGSSSSRGMARYNASGAGGGQWEPALHNISEMGT
ncbi:hypothetical protein Tsubulata_000847 [Turnera subulata]|uniref:DUF4228 domain-containing protein n=1 Tax=Turnera subulata TaxID=218843 RepID=A0A9Q0JJR4_9ROSI|nr:hypothetical protein Tsubulata_000847 [Turnera subulata]